MSVVTEIVNIFDTLSGYFTNQATSVDTGSVGPEVTGIQSLNYSESLSFSYDSADGAGAYSVGATQEAVFSVLAVQRELDMAFEDKGSIYLNYQSEQQDEADYYKSSGAYYSGVSSGSPTNGSQS